MSREAYRRFLGLTIFTVCLLILAGGIVRSTGSGMGCPDWPKCFGQWVPPTNADELPDDYREDYSLLRHKKNLRLASYLEWLNFNTLAERLRNDPSIRFEAEFNAAKTWIEYLNRLLGAITGILVLLNVVFAFQNRTHHRLLFPLSIILLLLTGFQGWVGSIVVSTNLLGGMITFHMVLALIILGVIVISYDLMDKINNDFKVDHSKLKKAYPIVILGTILFMIQVALGSQVREAIDVIAQRLGDGARSNWIEELGLTFYIHRSYSIVIMALHLYFGYLLWSATTDKRFRMIVTMLLSLIGVEIITGAAMAYFGVPPILQPIHLLLATLVFGIDIYLILQIHKMRITQMTEQPKTSVAVI